MLMRPMKSTLLIRESVKFASFTALWKYVNERTDK